MIGGIGGLGNSGQRIITHETEQTQTRQPVKNAIIGALSLDVAIVGVMAIAAILGYGAVPLISCVLAERLGGRAYRVAREQGIDHDSARVRSLSLAALIVIVGLLITWPVGRYIEQGTRALWFSVSIWFVPLLRVPWGIWFMILALVILVLFKQEVRRPTLISLVLVLSTYCVYATRHQAEDAARALLFALARFRWALIPLLLPWIGFAFPLLVRNLMETLVGSTWPPVLDREQLSEVGLLGLFGLRRREQPPEIDWSDSMLVRTDAQAEGQRVKAKITGIPRPDPPERFYEYALDILTDHASLSRRGSRKDADGLRKYKGATDYGYSQSQWPKLAAAFVRGKLAEKAGAGLSLTDAGWGYLVGQVARAYGADRVPERYAPLLARSRPLDVDAQAPNHPPTHPPTDEEGDHGA